MPMPKSNLKINTKGVKFTSNIDAASYTIRELSRAALRDVARLVKYNIRKEFNQLHGMKKAGGRFKGSFQHWLRSKEADLQIGIKASTWYGVEQELGTHHQPKRDLLRKAVAEHIADIVRIESQYLSGINVGSSAHINESEEVD